MPTEAGQGSWIAIHAGTIQLVVSLVTLVGLIVLARSVRRVLRLAGSQGEARGPNGTLAPAVAALEARRREYRGLIAMLRSRLDALPSAQDRADAIRAVEPWDAADVARLQALAAELDPEAGPSAIAAAAALRWLRDRIEEVKAIAPDWDVRWDHFPWHRWSQDLGRARAAAEAMATSLAQTDGVTDLPRSRSTPPADVTASAA